MVPLRKKKELLKLTYYIKDNGDEIIPYSNYIENGRRCIVTLVRSLRYSEYIRSKVPYNVKAPLIYK
jgi:transcription elongation factor